jgi:hypothetical protein
MRSSQLRVASDISITARMAWHQAVISRRMPATINRSSRPTLPDSQPPTTPTPTSQRLALAQK